MIEDAELLRRYVEDHSEDAFAELVRRHLGLVYGCALRRVGGDPHLAQDVAQQVFADVARRAAVLARRPVLAGWLFTSTRFAAAKAMRASRRRLAREQEVGLMHELSQDPMTHFAWDKARPVLDDAMAELNERDREAILLRFFEGRDFPSLGARLKLSDNAARMRVERALEKLRGRLERRGVTSTATVIATVLSEQAAVALPAGLATNVTTGALAVATGAGAAGGAAIAFMSVTKLQIGLAGVLIVAGGAGIAIQAQHNGALRRENANLQEENRELRSLRLENEQLHATALEVAAMRDDEAALARLRDESAALQARLQSAAANMPVRTEPAPNVPAHKVSERTIAALRNLKRLQDTKDYAGMMVLIDGLLSQAEPTSYDMAYLLDLKAKIFLQEDKYKEAIEPWDKALQLSKQYQYFSEPQMFDMAQYLEQLRYTHGLSTKVPPAPWF